MKLRCAFHFILSDSFVSINKALDTSLFTKPKLVYLTQVHRHSFVLLDNYHIPSPYSSIQAVSSC